MRRKPGWPHDAAVRSTKSSQFYGGEFYGGELWKHELADIFMPNLEKCDVVAVEMPENAVK